MKNVLRVVAVGVGLIATLATAFGAGEKRLRPLKVFILAGQSNMQGHAQISTIPSMATDPKTARIFKDMVDANGKPVVCKNVWISSIGCGGNQYSDMIVRTGHLTTGFGASRTQIGPELTFGIYMEKALRQPILIIKTSWGGRSLMTDFRPPSAGPRTFSALMRDQWKKRRLDPDAEAAKTQADCGVFYRNMIAHVKNVLANIQSVVPGYDPKQGYQLAGFVWFQGFNDMIDDWSYPNRMQPGGYDDYSTLLEDFIRDVRTDLEAPKLPFVIGVMGIGGEKEGEKPPQSNFREAEIAPTLLPEFKGNVVAVQTAPFWNYKLGELRIRLDQLNNTFNQEAKKHPEWTRAQHADALAQAKTETFSPAELKELESTSNGDYHYLGAARILAPIGKAFAEAALRLQRTLPKIRH